MKSDPQEDHKKRRYAQKRFINRDSEALIEDRKKIMKQRKIAREDAYNRLIARHGHKWKWSYQMRLEP